MSAGAARELIAAGKRARRLGRSSLTHADETEHLGPAIGVAMESGLPFAYVGAGTPALRPAAAEELAGALRRILKGRRRASMRRATVAKKNAKGKKGRGAAAAPDDARPRLSAHPRARRQIREAKAWSGLVGFVPRRPAVARGRRAALRRGRPRAGRAAPAATSPAGPSPSIVWSHIARAEVLVAEQQLPSSGRSRQE